MAYLQVNDFIEEQLCPLARHYAQLPARAKEVLVERLQYNEAKRVHETLTALAACKFLPKHSPHSWNGLQFGIPTEQGGLHTRYTIELNAVHEQRGPIRCVLVDESGRTRDMPRKTVRDYIMMEHQLCSRATFDLARLIEMGHHSGLTHWLGIPGADTYSVCPCLVGQSCTLSTARTILDQDYFDKVKQLQGPSADSWKGVKPPVTTCHHTCVCGRQFQSSFALGMHIASCPSDLHDLLPEHRPRLGGACILLDATAPNPFGAVLAASSGRFPSRALHPESSTSTEIRQYTIALALHQEMIPDGCEVLLYRFHRTAHRSRNGPGSTR